MKLNKLFYLLVAISAIFVACNNNDTPDTPKFKGTLEVTEKAVEIKFFGGEGVINYTITNGLANALPIAVANKEWVRDLTVGESIKFNVDLNHTEEARVASVTVTYGEQTFEVFVRQEAGYEIDVEFTAGALNGEQFGKTQKGLTNYFAILSKNGTTGWGIGHQYIDTYYRLDMFHTAEVSNPLILPQGVYEFDPYAYGDKISFGGNDSVRLQNFEDGSYDEKYFSDGVVIVTENKIEAILVLTTDEVHHVVYEGSLELGYIPMPTPDYYSNLTDDLTFNHTQGIIRLKNYGAHYKIGYNNWSVSMVLPGNVINGDYFSLDIITDDLDNSNDGIIGTYTCVPNEDSVGKNTFIAGDYLDQFSFSWYFDCVDNSFGTSFMAPL